MRPTNKYKTHRPDCQHPWGTPDVCGCLQENLYDRISELEAENGIIRTEKNADAEVIAALIEALERIEDLTQHNMPMTAREEQCVNREARAAIAKAKELTK